MELARNSLAADPRKYVNSSGYDLEPAMAFLSDLRSLWQSGSGGRSFPTDEGRVAHTDGGVLRCDYVLTGQTGRLIDLFSGIFQQNSERVFRVPPVWLAGNARARR